MNIKIYVKEQCPWCIELEAMLNTHGIKYERLNVSKDENLFHEMQNISDQEMSPTVVMGEEIFPDTDKEEIKKVLIEKGIIKDSEINSNDDILKVDIVI